MIGINWDAAQIVLTQVRFQQLGSIVRRRLMAKVGNEASKPMLAAVKEEERASNTEVTGTLAKGIVKKVKAYAKTNSVFVAAGAKSKPVTVTQYKDYRTGQIRRWKAGQPKKGPKIQKPSKYFHLAGPQRKGVIVTKARVKCKAKVLEVIKQVFTDEVMKRT